MLYTDDDLDTLERNAWQAGDLLTADLAARVAAAEESEAKSEEIIWELEKEKADLESALDDYKVRVREFLDELHRTIEGAARVSGRAELLASLVKFDTE